MKKTRKLSLFKLILMILLGVFILSLSIYCGKELRINTITIGETSRSEVESILGAPVLLVHNKTCTDYDVVRIQNSSLYFANLGRGIKSCSKLYPESKFVKRCFYQGNPLKLAEDIEIFYNEDEIVCSEEKYYST